MNLANLIEDGKLKVSRPDFSHCNAIFVNHTSYQRSFIVATLVSTVIGTFTASMTLHDKLQDKRARKEQKALDGKQDDEINKLRTEVGQLRVESNKKEPSRSRSGSRDRRRRRRRDSSDDSEEFRRSARRSRAMIEHRYEDNLMRMGPRYAQGDGWSQYICYQKKRYRSHEQQSSPRTSFRRRSSSSSKL